MYFNGFKEFLNFNWIEIDLKKSLESRAWMRQ